MSKPRATVWHRVYYRAKSVCLYDDGLCSTVCTALRGRCPCPKRSPAFVVQKQMKRLFFWICYFYVNGSVADIIVCYVMAKFTGGHELDKRHGGKENGHHTTRTGR